VTRILATGLIALALAGCATSVAPPPRHDLFNDALFKPPSERIDARDVFAANDAMRKYLQEIAPELADKGPQQGLFDALYSKGQLRLEYDGAMTRTAAQTFAERAGNCLSLVIMTATLAKELGLEVFYQRVYGDTSWSRSGDVYFASGHINVTLARYAKDSRTRYDERQKLTIDFMPPQPGVVPRVRDLKEATIIAMYMNNRAAEAYARGNFDDAYWWAREAIVQDPGFTSSYNTLGVVYKNRRHFAEAEAVLKHVLAQESRNLNAMQNLALVYKAQGRTAESTALSDQIKRIQPDPPFHYFNLGMEAMAAREFRKARALFEREVDREPYYHEFHFWLAVACLRLDEGECAKKHLALALENSATRKDHELYAAKLDRLKAKR
jgi:tetratricopeptide (TPR) repeat protein